MLLATSVDGDDELNMPGETKMDISGWTVDTLKAYIERLFDEHDKRYEQRFAAQEKAVKDALTSASIAVDKAEGTAEKWRQNANEWRGTLNDRDRLLMPRIETEQRLKALDDKIVAITRICVGVVVLGIAVITVVLLILRK